MDRVDRAASYIRWLSAVCLSLVILSLAGCGTLNGVSDQQRVYHVLGDPDLGDLPQALTNGYEAYSRSGVLTYSQAGYGQIVDALRSGKADIAFFVDSDGDHAAFSTPIGYQALVVVTSRDVSIDNISQADLQAVFSGQKTNWAEVGGPDLPIQLVVPLSPSSARNAFQARIMHGEPFGASARVISPAAQWAALIDSGSGLVGFSTANQVTAGMKMLAVDGLVVPTDSGHRAAYPLAMAVLFATPFEPQGRVKMFLDWVVGAYGQQIVARYGIGID